MSSHAKVVLVDIEGDGPTVIAAIETVLESFGLSVDEADNEEVDREGP